MNATVLHVRPQDGEWTWTDTLPESVSVTAVRTLEKVEPTVAATPVDCVVVEHVQEASLSAPDAVEAVRAQEASVPVVVSSRTADGTLAARATRRGATEYYPREESDDALANRVAALIAESEVTSPETQDDEAGERQAVADGSGEEAGGVDDVAAVASDGPDAAFEALAATVTDGVVVLDRDDRIQFANEAVESVSGYEPTALVGEHFETLLPEDQQRRQLRMIAEYRSQEQIGDVDWGKVELPIRHRTGEVLTAAVSLGQFEADGDTCITVALRDVTDKERTQVELRRNERSLRELQSLASKRELDLDAKIASAIDVGRDRLDLGVGYLARIDEDAESQTIEYATGEQPGVVVGKETRIDETFCNRTIEVEGMLNVPDFSAVDWGDGAQDRFGLRCYAGAELTVDGGLYGTLCFGDSTPRDRAFTDAERSFVELLAEWVSYELERARRDERLSNLLETSQSLLGARTPEEVAGIVARETEEVLGYDLNAVRLHDPETDQLEAVASTLAVEKLTGELPIFAVGEGGVGSAFERGESVRYSTLPDRKGPVPIDGIEDILYLPLGDAGVLSIGVRDESRLDEADLSLAEVLASTARVALARSRREQDMLRYQTVVENVQDMVYVLDEEGKFSLVTERFADWLGYEQEEVIGMGPTDVITEQKVAEFQSVIADLWHSEAFDESRAIEVGFYTAGDERRPAEVEVSLFPVEDSFNGTVGVVRDLTELRRTQKQLEDERDRFSYLFNSLPNAVVEVEFDADDRPVAQSVNPAFTQIFGYNEDEIVGRNINDYLLPEGHREEGRQIDSEATAGKINKREVRRQTATGFRDFLLWGIPYPQEDGTMRGFGIYTDITSQKERERRLEVLHRVLRHNLRNDLNLIMGYADMLADEVPDPDLSRRAAALREKATELTSISDRARKLERAVDRGSALDRTVEVEPIVRRVAEELAADHPAASFEIDQSVGRTVVGDDRLEFAVENIVENAVEHAEDSAPTVRVTAERDQDIVDLRIEDDGPGIPEEERAVITGDREITQLTHGSGLGLWVAKWACESCGGKLLFEDTDLGGSAVVLRLASTD